MHSLLHSYIVDRNMTLQWQLNATGTPCIGQPFTLTCTSSISPDLLHQSQVQWYRDGVAEDILSKKYDETYSGSMITHLTFVPSISDRHAVFTCGIHDHGHSNNFIIDLPGKSSLCHACTLINGTCCVSYI